MPRDPRLTDFARQLRRNLTPAERILWTALRSRRFDELKFRRQYPLGKYVLDFFCPTLGVAVELDGESHVGKGKADQFRDKWLQGQGCYVLRVWNPDIYDDLEVVLEALWQICMERLLKGCKRSRYGWYFPSPPAPLPASGERGE